MIKDIFNRLKQYLVFYDNDGERENDYYIRFENDIITNNGADTIEIINTLLNNNDLLAFPYFDDLTEIKRDIKKAVFVVNDLNNKQWHFNNIIATLTIK